MLETNVPPSKEEERDAAAEAAWLELSPAARRSLAYAWVQEHARPNQLAPGSDPRAEQSRAKWRNWIVDAGRGFGKTRTGAEWIRRKVEIRQSRRIALIGATAADARDVMVEGPAGILAISPPGSVPHYEPSKRRLTWPNGAIASIFTADEPNRLRGPQFDTAWCDELAAWRYVRESWDMLQMGLRLGSPQCVITTTPRPLQLLRELLKDPETVVSRGSTYDNAANLSANYLDYVKRRYEGTRLGRQELMAEMLDDAPGALWKRDNIDALRRERPYEFIRVVIAIDPAVSHGEESDETGIIAAGIARCKCKGDEEIHGFVFDDGSGRHSPNEWGQIAVRMFNVNKADRIVAEENNGGNLVEANVRTVSKQVSYQGVRASRGKQTRAEPIAALYEQGKIHHVGSFAQLEDQLCGWVPGEKNQSSPDRLDACVWALTALMLGPAIADLDDDDEFAGGSRRF